MTQEMDKLIEKTIVLACIIGVVVAAFLIWASYQESYSSLYIYPDSYSNYVNAGDTISFVSVSYTHLTLPTTPYV